MACLIKQEALALLSKYIQCEIPALAGKVCEGPASANHKLQYPSLVINPIRWKVLPDQPEVWRILTPSECISRMGRYEGLIQLTLSANSYRQRAELEQCISDLFWLGEYGPGSLKFVADKCYDGIVVWTLDEQEWENEKAWDKKWSSQMTLTLEIPALVFQKECYTINQLNILFSEDLSGDPDLEVITLTELLYAQQNAGDTTEMRAFQFTVPSDGDTWPVTIPDTAMPDTTYVALHAITTIPAGGSSSLLEVLNSSKTTTGFTLNSAGTLKAGTVVEFILRDFA